MFLIVEDFLADTSIPIYDFSIQVLYKNVKYTSIYLLKTSVDPRVSKEGIESRGDHWNCTFDITEIEQKKSYHSSNQNYTILIKYPLYMPLPKIYYQYILFEIYKKSTYYNTLYLFFLIPNVYLVFFFNL